MKYKLYLLTLLVPVFFNIQHGHGAADPSQPPRLSARAYALFDYSSQQFLQEENSKLRIEPASLTKLMTAYIVFDALKQNNIRLKDSITPSAQALRTEPADSRMYLTQGKPATIDELLHGLIIISANDAAHVLAETIAGNEISFAELMNREAQRLGMEGTHFANATGLPNPQHYSTAHDLAVLTSAIMKDFPEFLPLYAQREYEYRGIRHYNRNRLLWLDPHVDGMKTGHTETAGYCLIATAKRNNNHRMISVLLGSNSDNQRTSESQRLLNHGYQDFELYRFYKPGEAISKVRIWKGTEREIGIGLKNGLTLTLPKGQRELLKATLEIRQPLLAPVTEGQQLGVLKLTLDGKPYQEAPLVAVESVALVNIFSRGIDSIRMMFSN